MTNSHRRLEQYRRNLILASIFDRIVSRQAAVASLAFLLIVVGSALILRGVKDDGIIDLRTPVVSGTLQTGLVGMLVLFAGVFVTVLLATPNILPRPAKPSDHPIASPINQKVRIQKDGSTVEWEGYLGHWQESFHVTFFFATLIRQLGIRNAKARSGRPLPLLDRVGQRENRQIQRDQNKRHENAHKNHNRRLN